jgi:hypothetical protein
MTRILIVIGVSLFIGILVLQCNIPMTKSSIVGTYANTNYNNEPCCLEAPHKPDTLTLKSDGTYSSEFYGKGNYKVRFQFLTTDIEWTYTDKAGKSFYSAHFSNKIYEKRRIILNYDLNHYYEKID